VERFCRGTPPECGNEASRLLTFAVFSSISKII
jgi:hypothetical protein